METLIEKSTVKKKTLSELKLKRENSGVTVYIKSAIIEEYMKNVSGGEKQTGNGAWGKGMGYYKIAPMQIEDDGDYHRPPKIMNWGMESLLELSSGHSNMSFLRAVGLKDGVTIKFPGLFLGRDIDWFKADFKRFISKFYNDYVKIQEFEIVITTND